VAVGGGTAVDVGGGEDTSPQPTHSMHASAAAIRRMQS